MAAAALLMVAVGDTSVFTDAASHRDSPLIMEDPTADNTDVYAFVSTEHGRGDYVTLIANYIPLEEPGEGPNYYHFSDNVLYEIMVDTNGDAKEDLTYQFDFTTKIGAVTPKTFLYNTGKIGLPPNPSDPAPSTPTGTSPQATPDTGRDGRDDDDDKKTARMPAGRTRASRRFTSARQLDRQRRRVRGAGDAAAVHTVRRHSRLRGPARRGVLRRPRWATSTSSTCATPASTRRAASTSTRSRSRFRSRS